MLLPTPEPDDVPNWVDAHLAALTDTPSRPSSLRGGQAEADRRLAALDITGYAAERNEVLPLARRGATQLSPWIRHGLLQLPQVWSAVADAPSRDRQKFRDELLWQEYARHWYARLGARTTQGVRRELAAAASVEGAVSDDEVRRVAGDMACLTAVIDELHDDGWLVNQTRMWFASHWAVRSGLSWRTGEDHFFRHLLDGSRAANRLGWQWTSSVGASKHYGFSRSQVERRAPGCCRSCSRRDRCPIEDWPDDPPTVEVEAPASIRRSDAPGDEAGPGTVETTAGPEAVWLTAESLGDGDPALTTHRDLPAIFVFDEPLLAHLRLQSKRLVFLAETLADLATRRRVEVHLGNPVDVLAERAVAVTFAPVPGFRRRMRIIGPVEMHPWPWLARPVGGPVQSFSVWRRSIDAPG